MTPAAAAALDQALTAALAQQSADLLLRVLPVLEVDLHARYGALAGCAEMHPGGTGHDPASCPAHAVAMMHGARRTGAFAWDVVLGALTRAAPGVADDRLRAAMLLLVDHAAAQVAGP